MKFGYFTLSDNRYPNNPRSPEQFLVEIRDQAVLAEKLGLHSAWIGEHHFNRRGCVSVPAVVLANIAAATTRLRLAPAVVVLPIHHPIHFGGRSVGEMTRGLGPTGNQSQDEGDYKPALHRVSHGVRPAYPSRGVNYP